MSTRAWFGWMVKKPMSINRGPTQSTTMPTTNSTTPIVWAGVARGMSSGGSMVAPATMQATHAAARTNVSSSRGQPFLAWMVFSTDAPPVARAVLSDMTVPFSPEQDALCARPHPRTAR